MVSYVNWRIKYLSDIQRCLQAALQNAPEGTLKIKHIRSCFYFYIRKNGMEMYINTSSVAPYATKRYNSFALKAVEQEINALNAYLKRMPEIRYEGVLASMPDGIKPYITPAVMTNEQYAQQWQAQPFTPKGFKSNDDSAYYTKKGERVRSKSEILIADMLFDLGIPYKYEKPLLLSGGKYLFHPDFSILKVSTREEVYLEHLGKMDDDGYTDDFAYKYRIYMSNGIYLGQKLFLTCESGSAPLDNRLIKEFLIKTFK